MCAIRREQSLPFCLNNGVEGSHVTLEEFRITYLGDIHPILVARVQTRFKIRVGDEFI